MSRTIRSSRVRRSLAGVLGAAALAGAAVVATAGPAAADQTCTGAADANVCLNITPAGGGNYAVHVGIDVHMAIGDAQSILAGSNGHPFSAVMWGDDSPASDQYLFSFPRATDEGTWVAGNGQGNISADFDFVVPRSALDEDTSFFNGRDEVFTRIYLYDARSGTSRVFRSNTWYQSF